MAWTSAVAALLALVAASSAVADNTSITPEQIHIAFAGEDRFGNPNAMSVAWFTHHLKEGHGRDGHHYTGATVVQYGPRADNLTNTAAGFATQYMWLHGYHHSAVIGPLAHSAEVFYRVGDGNVWSKVFSFRTAPATTKSTIKLSIFGDMGYKDSIERPMKVATAGLAKNWSATHSRVQLEALKNNKEIDGVWHVGDIGYMDDAFAHHPVEMMYESTYNDYVNWLQNLTATMPYMVSVGNHESENHAPLCVLDPLCGLVLNNFTSYNHRWHMPWQASGGVLNMWYSFNWGPVHFVSLNTETDFKGAGEETHGDSGIFPAGGFGAEGEYMAWLEADLKAADAARKVGGGRPWIVAGGHRPQGGQPAAIQALFDKYNVDMYFCGHGHSYSRSLPAFDGRVEKQHKASSPALYVKPNATTWIMVGGAGCDEMAYGNKKLEGEEASDGPGTSPAPNGAEVVTYNNYATGVLVANTTHLNWRLIDSVNSSVIDEVVIANV